MNVKKSKIFALTLLSALLMLAVIASVNAQTTATVIVVDSPGGTTDPPAGTTTPADGTTVTFTETPDAGYVFSYWVISTSDGSNTVDTPSFDLPVVGGTTYGIQAVFVQILTVPGQSALPSNMATAAIVVVLQGAGGSTSPAPGTYAMDSATSLNLTATPASGWTFSHWVISGPNLSHGGYPFTATPVENPYNVNHGYGATYSYQPVFVPTGVAEPTPMGQTPMPTTGGGSSGGLSTDNGIEIGLVVVIVIILIAFGVFMMRKKK